jgi:hypothetical protein
MIDAEFLDAFGKKRLKSFPPCYSNSPPPPPSESGLRLVCNGTLYAETSRLCPETSTKLYVNEDCFIITTLDVLKTVSS